MTLSNEWHLITLLNVENKNFIVLKETDKRRLVKPLPLEMCKHENPDAASIVFEVSEV